MFVSKVRKLNISWLYLYVCAVLIGQAVQPERLQPDPARRGAEGRGGVHLRGRDILRTH